jgi:tetratricopeptide (TPR) repeat protein
LGAAALPRLKEEHAQGSTLNDLACVYGLSGRPRRAAPLFEAANAIYEKRGDKGNLASGLENLAIQQMITGALRAAEASLRRAMGLSHEIEDEFSEAVEHQELGRLLAYRGAWQEAEPELAASSRYWEQTHDPQGLCIDEAHRALRALLLARALTPTPLPCAGEGKEQGGEVRAAVAAARRALELADEWARTQYPVEYDYVRAHWLLGAAHRADGATTDADRHLSEALARCRRINMVDHEAGILLDLARLRQATGREEEALTLAQEALLIAERSGYALQAADAHLFLGERERGEKALAHAREARRLATCDGPPDYTYKVAYDEAGALLARLGG